jgi:uncharacterized protein YndB with AHSA1/START domain
MPRGFEAVAKVVISAPASKVWEALTDPTMVKQYMHGTDMSVDWKPGGAITWRGEWKGQAYEDKGTVLEVEPQKRLSCTHWSPMGGSEDRPENYHTVTYELSEEAGRTTLRLTQDNNPTQDDADKMAANNWGPVLEALKKVAES